MDREPSRPGLSLRRAPSLSTAWAILQALVAPIAAEETELLESEAEHDVEEVPSRTVVRPTRGFHLEVLAGVTRWKWNEVVFGSPPLEELGFVPVAKLAGTWVEPPLRLRASLEFLSGAIAYRGYRQSRTDFSLVPFESNTHYLAATPEVSLQWRKPGRLEWLRPVASISRPWWRRTLDGTEDQKPGRFGYVETWSVLTASLGLEVGRRVGTTSELTLLGKVLVPLSTSESIVSKSGIIELEPGTRTGIRLEARWTYRELYLGEVDFQSVRYEESDPVALTEDGIAKFVFQPESRLERISWRVGRVF